MIDDQLTLSTNVDDRNDDEKVKEEVQERGGRGFTIIYSTVWWGTGNWELETQSSQPGQPGQVKLIHRHR